MELERSFYVSQVLPYVKNTGRISVWDGLNIIRKYYCRGMEYHDLCSNCQECIPNLRDMLELNGTKSPGGALIYRCKSKVATMVDKRQERKESGICHQPIQCVGLDEALNQFLKTLGIK